MNTKQNIVANLSKFKLHALSAVSCGLKEVEKEIMCIELNFRSLTVESVESYRFNKTTVIVFEFILLQKWHTKTN